MNLNYHVIWDLCEPYILDKMNISKDVYNMYRTIVFQYKEFNYNVRYAGRGDSSDKHESLTSKLVPEISRLINYLFYIHDNLYSAIEDKVLGVVKENVDLLLLYMMQCFLDDDSIIDDIYYFGVKNFG